MEVNENERREVMSEPRVSKRQKQRALRGGHEQSKLGKIK